MIKIELKILSSPKDYQIFKININGNGIISPEILKSIHLPSNTNPKMGVIIYGKAPIWLYTFLSHELHFVLWVATFDPRIGAIIVQKT